MNAFYDLADQWVRMLWALSWQIALLVGLISVVSFLCRRASPGFRYGLWCIVLVRLCLPVNVVLPFGIGSDVRQAAETYARSVLSKPDTVNTAVIPGGPSTVAAMNLSVSTDADPDEVVQPSRPGPSRPDPRPMPFSAKIAFAWMLLSTSFAGIILFRSVQTHRLLRSCPNVSRPDLVAFLEQLHVRCAIHRPLRTVCASSSLAISGPAVIGIMRPTLVLPTPMVEQWTTEELEPVLLHELAHVKRWDLLVNLAQMVVQAIYFFHPLVWYANAKIRRERELVCDDLAVLHSGGRRKRYSQSIVRVLEEIVKDEPLLGSVSLGMTEQRHSLAKRIVRMMSQNYRLHKPVGWLSVAALVLLAAVGIALASEHAGTTPASPKTDTSSPGTSASERMSFDELKAAYSQQAIELSPEIRKYREESPFYKALNEAMDGIVTTIARGEKARRQLVEIYAAGKQEPKSLGPEFKIDPKDGDIIGHPMIDRVVGSLFRQIFADLEKVVVPGSTEALGLARIMVMTKQETPLEDPANFKNPYEEGSYAAISLDRAVGEAVPQVAILLAKGCNPLPAPLQEKLSAAEAMYGVMKEKAYREKREGDLPERVMNPIDVSFDRMGAAASNPDSVLSAKGVAPGNNGSDHAQREILVPGKERPKGDASISGKVVDATTGEPVGHARVYLFYNDTLTPIFIDVASDGAFKFEGIPGGVYSLSVTNTAGFVNSQYDPDNVGGQWPTIQLGASEQKAGVLFKLQRAHSIAGTVSTEEGQALSPEGSIQVVAWTDEGAAGDNGNRYSIAKQALPDRKTGEYLLDGLDGRPVYVMALDFRAQEKDYPYQATYAPGTFSRDEATRITFDKESAVKNVDIRLRKTGGTVLEGTVTSRATGQPIPKTLVVAHHRDMLFDRAVAYTDEQGHYRLECLGPGEFLVHADATPWGYVRARKLVIIKAAEKPTPLDLTLLTGGTIFGKFTDEVGSPWKIQREFGSAYVSGLTHEGGSFSGVPNKYLGGRLPQPVMYFPGEGDYESIEMTFPEDGSFVVNGMMPGQVLLTFNPYTEGLHVVRIDLDGRDVTATGGITLAPGQAVKDVNIVIGAAAETAPQNDADCNGEREQADPKCRRCCQNLKQLGLIFKMFANEGKGMLYPELSSEPGQLMFSADAKANDKVQGLFPEYMTDTRVLVCPASEEAARLDTPEVRANVKQLINDHSYVYLGYAVTDDAEVKTFADAYRAQVAKGSPPLEDLPVAEGMQGSGGGSTLYRLRGGVERRIAKNANDDAEAASVAAQIPVLIERLGHHETEGGNVLYLDGKVRWVSPGVWPLTKAANDALSEMMSLSKK